jgi:hypothetical protein
MARIRLIHFHADEAKPRVARLREAGHRVLFGEDPPTILRKDKKNPPDAFVIDLTRMPSGGRDMGLALREAKATRQVPLVFVDGAPDKIAMVKKTLPDAVYCSWRGIRGGLKKALSAKQQKVVVPAHRLAGYSGTPLPKKLGIKDGTRVLLVAAPQDFEKTLGTLPDGASIRRRGKGDLALWFVTRRRDLEGRIDAVAARMTHGLWICWPKKASGMPTEVAEADVRRTGLDHGLVDYKIAAIDATWSGLKFAVRKK